MVVGDDLVPLAGVCSGSALLQHSAERCSSHVRVRYAPCLTLTELESVSSARFLMATTPNARMNRYLAEVVGTFVLVFTGIGTAVLAGDQVGAIGVAAAFGLALLAMVYAVGPISGCHLNPAVTLGLLLTGKFERRHAPWYIVAQIVGAIVAAGMVLLIAKGAPGGYDATAAGLGANGFDAIRPAGTFGGPHSSPRPYLRPCWF